MDVYDSNTLISILTLLRSGIWLLLIAEVLAGHQTKRIAGRLAAKGRSSHLRDRQGMRASSTWRGVVPDWLRNYLRTSKNGLKTRVKPGFEIVT